jgi:very-short-patch-repair endonuclease
VSYNGIKQIPIKDKPRKKPWIFYCAGCRDKISSETHKFFYTNQVVIKSGMIIGIGNCCSLDCANKETKSLLKRHGIMSNDTKIPNKESKKRGKVEKRTPSSNSNSQTTLFPKFEYLPDIIQNDFTREIKKLAEVLLKPLNQCESPIEQIFAYHLCKYFYVINDLSDFQDIKIELNAQEPIEINKQKYRVDFLLIFNEGKIVIECDGHDYHEKTKQQAQRDKSRDRNLQKEGYIVLRFTGSEIYKDPIGCVNEVVEVCRRFWNVEEKE